MYENGDEKYFKLCGVLIDDQLSWKHHINYVRSKIVKALAYISTSKKSLPREVKKLLYKSIVESQFNYCLSVWGGASGRSFRHPAGSYYQITKEGNTIGNRVKIQCSH